MISKVKFKEVYFMPKRWLFNGGGTSSSALQINVGQFNSQSPGNQSSHLYLRKKVSASTSWGKVGFVCDLSNILALLPLSGYACWKYYSLFAVVCKQQCTACLWLSPWNEKNNDFLLQLVTHAETRNEALDLMNKALDSYVIRGAY